MNHLFYVAVTATLFCSGALVISLLGERQSQVAARRLQEVTQGSKLQPVSGTGWERLLQYLAAQVHRLSGRMGSSGRVTLRGRIVQAGFKGPLPEDLYIAGRLLGPIAGFLMGSLIDSNRGFWMMSFAAVAYLLPDVVLQRMVKRRREKIRRSLADAVDLLVICVDAGLGLDQALLRVSQELGGSHPEITAELLQINGEQRAGKPRVEAWQDMDKRVDLPDLHAFVNMLMQTERFGTPIARALSNFADGLRLKRRQKAEEMAAKTTVKIIFPLVLFIFPSIFIVLLGPAALTISRGLS
ncbi:MAG TPA: type II secretion system F family protein, partial [Acidobacteriaceae bacterium]